MTGRQRIQANRVSALKLWCHYELLNSVVPHTVTERRVAELRGADTLLLLLHAPAAFQRQPGGPFHILFGDFGLRRWVQQFQKRACGLLGSVRVPPAQSAPELDAALNRGNTALGAQSRPALAQEVAHKPVVIGEQRRLHLRHIPARNVSVNPVHKRRVIAHLRRHGAEQMPHSLLVLDIHLEVAHHHYGTIASDTLAAAAELAALHVPLHNVDAVFLVEGYAADLIEADDVILADQPPLPCRVVDEHARDCRFAAAHQVRIGAHLLEEMALAGAPGTKFHGVEVAFHERRHPQQKHVRRPFRHRRRLQSGAAEQELLPLGCGEHVPAVDEVGQHLPLAQLNRAKAHDSEWPPVLLLSDGRIVLHLDLCVETAGQHPFVRVVDKACFNADVVKPETRERGDVAVGGSVQTGGDQVYDLHRPALASHGLEQLLFTGLDRALAKLTLHDPYALLDLLLVGRGAVAPQEELTDVRGYGIPSLEQARKILAHDKPGKGLNRKPVYRIELCAHSPPPTVVCCCVSGLPGCAGSKATTSAACPSRS